MKTCESCKHWDKQKGYEAGWCRKLPPVFYIEHGSVHDGTQPYSIPGQPHLGRNTAACSQHEKKLICMSDRIAARGYPQRIDIPPEGTYKLI